jgi:putative membrane protein
LGIALVPIAVLVAADRYRNLGHAWVNGFVVSRQGSIVRRRYMVHRDGIIGWNEHQSFFQRRSGLVTLSATTAAGKQKYEILDVEPTEAVAIAEAATPGLLTPFLA